MNSADRMEIRSARDGDVEAIAELFIAQMREHRIERQKSESLDVTRTILREPHWGFLFVAERHKQVVGVIYLAALVSAEHGGKIGWVEELYVTPAARNRGIGGELLHAAIEEAEKLGWLALELEVDIDHRRAEALYQRLGFTALPRSRWVRKL